MIGKIIKFIFMMMFAALIFAAASVLGARNDDKNERLAHEESEAAAAEEAARPQEVQSPFEPHTGGVLELQIDYEVQMAGDDVLVSIVSNLPDGFDLTAELSNIEQVKRKLGFGDISSGALTQTQMNQINEQTYSGREKNFVTNGVSDFLFKDPPAGQLDLKVTSPITKLQPSTVAEILGEKGANLQGSYVVFLEEVDDKSINFNASFVVEEEEPGEAEEAPVNEATEEATEENSDGSE